jgi:hypothetical protein
MSRIANSKPHDDPLCRCPACCKWLTEPSPSSTTTPSPDSRCEDSWIAFVAPPCQHGYAQCCPHAAPGIL